MDEYQHLRVNRRLQRLKERAVESASGGRMASVVDTVLEMLRIHAKFVRFQADQARAALLAAREELEWARHLSGVAGVARGSAKLSSQDRS